MGWNWKKDNEKNYQEILRIFLVHNFVDMRRPRNSKLLYIIENDILVDSTKKNEEVILIFDKTPFMRKLEVNLGIQEIY